ncbi:polysaccharide deacetylase 2 family uncharacterized protein YibQ [Aliiruegeria haliotis]|uniref:Polysaccharide deacetylase 2 family uncharacterized protein YibQ n=1 Tax=Aliiruegeria haliotis TaxID=1280846 RepID=A0A2T0RZL5_9RHOB|nr:divergent polysaccharide deacetylase family protein [Aliiruegeria haliotis]PRY26590.1 polysaccharide deacetylase 2 family uncharacterized protein YibQ [Aliiruegeria haliotis]
MGRGILSGLFWGSVISVLVLGAVSQLTPLPREMAASGEVPATDDVPQGADGTGTEDVATLPAPEAESTPSPADPVGQPAAEAGDTDVTAELDVPAGSEFRRGLPEAEAALPESDATPRAGGTPAVPQPEADSAASLPGAEEARRPDTPEQSVTAPDAPAVGDDAITLAEIFAGAPEGGINPAPGPGEVATPAAENSPDAQTTQGFPPPITAESVVGETVLSPRSDSESLAPAGTATEADAVAAPEAAPAVMDQSPAAQPSGEVATIPGQAAQAVAPAPQTEVASGVVAGDGAASLAPADTAVEATTETAMAAAQPQPQTIVPQPQADPAAQPAPESTSPATADAERADAETVVAAIPPDVSFTVPAVPDVPSPGEESSAEPGQAARNSGAAPTGVGARVRPLTERGGGSNRLVQIGTDQPATETAEAEAEAAEDAEAPEPASLDALSRNAAPFANPEGKPLFSIVLVYDPTTGLDRSVLSTFSFPVTFAIDPTDPLAETAAADFADAGFEVVALATGLPEAAQPKDVEVALGAMLATVPQAVALMDPPEVSIAGNRQVTEQVLEILAEDGHGLIGWDRGLKSLKASADKVDQPAALIFRALDADGEKSPVIRRYLDRAAFKATQDGSVIMAGRSTAETVKALFEWALDGKASQVALAPVSAVLRQERDAR